MKTFCLILFTLIISILLLSFITQGSNAKKIMGHWATNDFMGYYKEGDTLGTGDTVTFSKIKFDTKFYYWAGGYMSGIEFKADSQFTQYRNVGCSDESDIKIGVDEKYFFCSDSIVEVKSILRDFRFKILYLTSKKLSIKILGRAENVSAAH
jgi:hypothetical protein